MATNRPDNR